jgi:hypothetical protein
MAKYYYMGLLASRIYRSGDMATLPLVLDLWNNSLVASGDIWVAKKGFPFIQDLYAALLHNNVKLPGGDLTIREYENENKQKIQVIASSDKEFDLFMKIISNQALTR